MVRRPAMLISFLLVTFGLALAASAESRGVRRQAWGKGPKGEAVELFTLTNAKGNSVAITTYGAIVVSINVPDKSGKLGDVVLGFDSLDGYLGTHPFFGAIVGRYGNRIGRRAVHPGRQDLHARQEQRRQYAARRREGLRQVRLEGA